MKKKFSLFLILSLFASILPSTKIFANNTEFDIVSKNENIAIYKEIDGESMYADVDVSIFEHKLNEEVVIFEDKEKDFKITATMFKKNEPSSNTRASGSTNWSAGRPPAGTYSMRVTGQYGAQSWGYVADFSCYPVKILDLHSEYGDFTGWNIDYMTLKIVRPNATSSLPALSQMNFKTTMEQLGVVVETKVGYLNMEMKDTGNYRFTWKW